jgi:membrane protein YdbS with pleckstrin-like domain
MSDAKYCEGCGTPGSQDARFCGACGRPFPAPEPSPNPLVEPAAVPGGGAAARDETELYDMRPLAVQGFGELLLCLLTVGIAWLVLWLRRVWTRYRITDQRIEVQTGVLERRRETIELFRVQDFEVQEPLFLRLRAAGNLVIRSMDPAEGEIVLRAVPDVQDVYETLRRAAIDERDRHRVRLLEGME